MDTTARAIVTAYLRHKSLRALEDQIAAALTAAFDRGRQAAREACIRIVEEYASTAPMRRPAQVVDTGQIWRKVAAEDITSALRARGAEAGTK